MTAWAARRAQRQQFVRDREAKRRDELARFSRSSAEQPGRDD